MSPGPGSVLFSFYINVYFQNDVFMYTSRCLYELLGSAAGRPI